MPDDAPYDVPANQPKRITIPDIGVRSYIEKVGIDQYKQIATPRNSNYTGWYTGSVKPGENGLSIIDGHVTGQYSNAVFFNLSKLKPGSNFTVEYGDGSTRTFAVVSTRSLPRSQATSYLNQQQSGIEQQLNLITCGGLWNAKSSQYLNRIVVVSKRIN